MSVRKRSFDDDEDDDDFGPEEKRQRGDDSGQEDLLESPSAGRQSGRVRKKSAKVLEMEEFEGLEKKSHTKTPAAKAGKKQVKGKAVSPVAEFPVVPVEGNPSALQHLLNSPLASGATGFFAQTMNPVQAAPIPVTINMPPVVSTSPPESIKLKLNLSAMAASQNPLVSPPGQLPPPPPSKSEKKAKAKASKKTKPSVLTDISPQIASVEALIKSNQAKQQAETGIKLKLKLSPTTETPKSPLREQLSLGLPTLSPPQLQPIEESKPKKKKQKKKLLPSSSELSPVVAGSPELAAALSQPLASPQRQTLGPPTLGLDHLNDAPLIIEEDKKSKKEPKAKSKTKSPKAKKKNQSSTTQASQIDVPESTDLSSSAAAPQYSNLQEMALKVQTSSEKKAGRGSTRKTGKKAEVPEKPRKKRGPTAYMMWCSAKRPEVVSNHPGIDFAEISRRLGELWHGVPEKEKSLWKRKAKRAASKAAMITTGKAAAKVTVVKSSLKKTGAASKAATATHQTPAPMPAVRHGGPSVAAVARPARPALPKPPPEQIVNITPQIKPVSCNPVDVAAHLKLLGEALSIIGTRLQEHRGHIAVQGTLSVLLDSMLCALGPLTSLTTQVPELNGCPSNVHSATLDNIAYYMPGIG